MPKFQIWSEWLTTFFHPLWAKKREILLIEGWSTHSQRSTFDRLRERDKNHPIDQIINTSCCCQPVGLAARVSLKIFHWPDDRTQGFPPSTFLPALCAYTRHFSSLLRNRSIVKYPSVCTSPVQKIFYNAICRRCEGLSPTSFTLFQTLYTQHTHTHTLFVFFCFFLFSVLSSLLHSREERGRGRVEK